MSRASLSLPTSPRVIGTWTSDRGGIPVSDPGAAALLEQVAVPVYAYDAKNRVFLADHGSATLEGGDGEPLVAYVPGLSPRDLGDGGFCSDYNLDFPYIAGAMANGIASVEVVETMGKAGMLGFFGAAGLDLPLVEAAIHELQRRLPDRPWGVNLIHSPNEPDHEAATVDLLLREQVRLVEASAYLDLTLPLVRYRYACIHRDARGTIVVPNRVIGKVSRVEVATKFFSPAPERLLRELAASGALTSDQAELAAQIPIASDLTAEADSGGHTDNRPAIALIPSLLALRDQMQARHGYPFPLRVGAAGGISTPAAVAAAFALGAAYVLTGTVNQACVESGSSDLVRQMLADASQADIAMAPAADMFEMGVKVQVLKRGTLFAMRAAKLYELYRSYESLDALPAKERLTLEKQVFRASLEEIWQETVRFFRTRDPRQIVKAEQDPRHKMALVFRWYLGLSSVWANRGVADRKMDYQVWCGPAMGAFNEWTRGSFLARPEERRVDVVARNLLYGAALLTRRNLLQQQGVAVPLRIVPRTPSEIDARLARERTAT